MPLACSRCGRVNREGAAFCGGCGQSLPSPGGGPASQAQNEFARYAQQARLALGKLWGQVRQEASGWYHDLVARQPEAVGEIITPPTAATATQMTQVHALFLPIGSQTTQLPASCFDLRLQGGGPAQAVCMVGPQTGGPLYAGDKVRAWGGWARDQGVLRAWRVEVWERGGRPASEVVATSRPFPLLLIGAVLLGFLLMSCLCSILTS